MQRIQRVAIVLLGLVFILSGLSEAKVKLVYVNNVTDVTANVEQQLIEMFMEENPDIEVEYRNAPITPDQLLLWAAGGMAPDVYMVHSHTVNELVGMGLLTPLDKFVKDDPEVDLYDLFPEGIEEFSVGGVLYGMPYEYHMVAALFYNADVIAESGLPTPPDHWEWEDFLRYAAKLVKTDGDQVTRWAFYCGHPLNFMHSWGGKMVDDWRNPTDTLIDSPEAIAGYEAYVDLVHRRLSPPTANYVNEFLGETTAMVLSGLWGSYAFKDANFQWDITLPPVGPNGGRGYEFVSRALGISTTTHYPEEAYRLLKFLAYDERALKIRALSVACEGVQGEMPARISVARGEAFVENDLSPKNKMLMLMVADYVYRMPRHPEARTIFNLAHQVGIRGVQGEPVRNVAISTAEQIRAILQSTE